MTGGKALSILLPSIIDPTFHHGGAGTATRTLLKLLQCDPFNAHVKYVLPPKPPKGLHRVRQLRSLARSWISTLPSKALFVYSKRFMRTIQQAIQNQDFDLVLLNGSDLLWLLPELPTYIPRVLIAHNIEHHLFFSQINIINARLPVFRQFLMRDYQCLKDYEMSYMQQIKNVIFLSSEDAKFSLTNFPNLNALVVPPLFDYPPAQRLRERDSREGLQIGFLANFGWWPNREGLRWFLKEVFPYTPDSTQLHLFGEQSSEATDSDPRIVQHGFMQKIEDIWPHCDFTICPIFCGGGVNVKFAEAVYNRVPVLASSFAARGLPLKPDPNIVLLDHAAEWIAFLRSANARALRFCTLPASLTEPFRMEAHIVPMQKFLRKILPVNVLESAKSSNP